MSKIEALLEYLFSLGFEGEQLIDQVRRQYLEFKSSFMLRHHMKFGEERMEFNLQFNYDRQFSAYRLSGYEAIHCNPIVIDHRVINGVDTLTLEQRMAAMDWDRLFLEKGEGLWKDPLASLIWKDLEQLPINNDFDGSIIRDNLLFKYLPRETWSISQEELSEPYEHKQSFVAGDNGLANTLLAYRICSGQYQELLEAIKHTGMELYSDIPIEDCLKVHLSRPQFLFELYATKYGSEGTLDIRTQVICRDDGFRVQSLEATAITYPLQVHGTYGEVDSHDFENAVKMIAWQDFEAVLEHDPVKESRIRKEVVHLLVDLTRLWESGSEGQDMAMYFYLRYIQKSDEVNEYISPALLDSVAQLPRRLASFNADTTIDHIYNQFWKTEAPINKDQEEDLKTQKKRPGQGKENRTSRYRNRH